MSILHDRKTRHRGRATMAIALTVAAGVLWLAAPAVQAQAPPAGVSPTGSVGGLDAKFVDVNGIRTRYYEAGQGEPLVMVHGEGWSGHSSANTWSKVIPLLAKRFHVFAPDKAGSGMTGNPLNDKDYNLQGVVEHIYQFIQTMKLGKVHLIGQSNGGGVSFFLTVLHPQVVKTLVVVNSNTASPDTGPTTRQEALAKCPKEPDCAEWQCRLRAISYLPDVAFDDVFFKTGCYMASLPKSQETVKKMAAGAGEPLRSEFGEWKKQIHDRVRNEGLLQMPVLIYWGAKDPSAMLRNGLALFDVISARNPNARMIIASNSGHFHYREHPEEWSRNVINFIDYWNGELAAQAAR